MTEVGTGIRGLPATDAFAVSPELAADAFRRLSQLQDVLGLGRSTTVHVDVSRADFSGTEQACARATTVAELIEPELR